MFSGDMNTLKDDEFSPPTSPKLASEISKRLMVEAEGIKHEDHIGMALFYRHIVVVTR